MISMFEENENFVYLKFGKRMLYRSMREYLEHNGKWMIYDTKEKVSKMASVMNKMVGRDGIMQIKLSKNPLPEVADDSGHGNKHVLMVYCDERDNEGVKEVLKRELEVGRIDWKLDKDSLLEARERGVEISKAFLDGLREMGEIE